MAFVRQAMGTARIGPLAPVGGIFGQQIAGEDAVARGILDVDVEVVAEHGDDDVEVDLELVGDSLLDRKEVGFMAAVPAQEFADGEEEGEGDQEEGGVAAGGGATGIGRFGFGWEGRRVSAVDALEKAGRLVLARGKVRPSATEKKRGLTEGIECPDVLAETTAVLVPKGALVKATVCEAIHGSSMS